ncbi:hypothetical protein BDQ17DRAFT_1410299 [Cyathus striatus]|nr:hypothetical protein BDQ17DRAFT_1410299 [Cyathus striatus]
MDSKSAENSAVVSEVISALAKEVKFYKARVQELEQAAKEQKCVSCSSDETREKLERAETVEVALQFKRETVCVKIDEEDEDGKLGCQQDVAEKEDSVDDDAAKGELESLVLHYKVKYKKYKAEAARLDTLSEEHRDQATAAKEECKRATRKLHDISEEVDQLKKTHTALDMRLAEAEERLDEATRNNVTSTIKQLHGHDDFCDYMQQFPLCEVRPRYEKLQPICSRDVNLKQYLAADRRTVSHASNFLYLPGMFMWSPQHEKHHGLGCGPAYIFNKTSARWEKSVQFLSSYGSSIELFFSCKEHIYYAGTYRCHNLRTMHEHGIAINFKNISLRAIADATFYTSQSVPPESRVPSNGKQKVPEFHQATIDRLYRDGILRVEYVGLECVGFNQDLQTVLKERFVYTIVPSKRNRPSDQPEDEASRGKKRRNKK